MMRTFDSHVHPLNFFLKNAGLDQGVVAVGGGRVNGFLCADKESFVHSSNS